MKFIRSQPLPQGGLGHQFQNWVLGLVIADLFNCEFINTDFNATVRNGPKYNWNNFLNFSSGLKNIENITPDGVIKLPPIDLCHSGNIESEELTRRLEVWKKIIQGAPDNTLIYLPVNQFPGMLSEKIYPICADFLKKCYWSANSSYNFGNWSNVVVHIRRGDIKKQIHSIRWLELSDYNKIMNYLRAKYNNLKFHIISEGKVEDFEELKADDVEMHINKPDLVAFNMMASAEILVTGLSSFSIMASYLNNGLVYYNPLLNYTNWDNVPNFVRINLETLEK